MLASLLYQYTTEATLWYSAEITKG